MPQWYWILSSEKYGNETFGPYPSEQEAKDGIARIQEESAKNPDGIKRFYSMPEEEKCCEQHVPDWSSLTIEKSDGEAYIDVNCRDCGTSGCVLMFKTEPETKVNWS